MKEGATSRASKGHPKNDKFPSENQKKNLGDIRQQPTMKPLGLKFFRKKNAGSLVHSHILWKK